jgi:hypothetical protein
LRIEQKTERNHPIIGSLLISSLLIAAVAVSVSIALLNVLRFSFLLFSLPSIISFLINPVSMFIVMYLLGRRINVARRYISVVVSLFLGGLIGSAIPYFLLPELFGSRLEAAFPTVLSTVTTLIAFTIILIEFAVSTLLYGFFAVSLGSFRHQRSASEQLANQPHA